MAKTHLRTDYQDGEELLAYDVNLITDTVNTLSDNDDTHEQEIEDINIEIEGIENKLGTIETGAQVNIIETVKVNGTALVPDQNKAVDVIIEDYTAGDNIDITNKVVSAKGYIWSDTKASIATKYLGSGDVISVNHATGNSSFASGYNTTASGEAAHSEGYMTTSSATGSHAEGHHAKATGASSHAEGYNTTASGDQSHSEGNGTQATGLYSHAEGSNAIASGIGSHAEGCGKSSGTWSHAEGLWTEAKGQNQHVSGKYNVVDNDSTYAEIIGNGTGDNARSNARTLDWSGNQWTAGDVLSGGTAVNPTHKLSDKVNSSDAILGVKVNGVELVPDQNRKVDVVTPEYNMVKDVNPSSEDYVATYHLTRNGVNTGAAINIPKDFLVKSASVKTCIVDNDPVTVPPLEVGDPYIDFVINTVDGSGTDQHVYINVKGLVDVYTAGQNINITNNQISALGYVWDSTTGSLATQYLENGQVMTNTATGSGSFAEGAGSTSNGIGSHAEGKGRFSGGSSPYAHAEGSGRIFQAGYAHAEGFETLAQGGAAHAEGEYASASGTASHAEGHSTVASGSYSHAEGMGIRGEIDYYGAQGQGSHVEGYNCQTKSTAIYSHAEGYNTVAASRYQHVSGKYNVEDNNNTYAEIIGNGVDGNNSSNARTLDWNGNQWTAGDVTTGGTVASPAHSLSGKANSSDVYTKTQIDTKIDDINDTIEEDERVTAAALNTINDTIAENERVTSAALTDLDDRLDIAEDELLGKANSSDVYTKAQADALFCKVVTLTQAQYDALPTKDPMTLYIISDAS